MASPALMANHDTTHTAGDLAVSIAAELYRAVTGRAPQALRAYQDEDALLVLLRFDPQEMAVDPADGVEPLLQTAFMAMPGMVATAVAARSGVAARAGQPLGLSRARPRRVRVHRDRACLFRTPPPVRRSGWSDDRVI